MIIFRQEWKRGKMSFLIWSGAIASMVILCMLLFPEMKDEMGDVSRLFSAMGAFTSAFGMDKINFGESLGFYGIECGNILGIVGAIFASLLGVSALADEEKNHTAEFLLTHPVSRMQVVWEKLLSVMTQILAMNVLIVVISAVSFRLIGEDLPVREFLLMHAAYLMMQVEIAAICFGISAFLRRGGLGIGIGLATVLYFLNLVANISKSADFLKYVTPFGYAEASDIISESALNAGMMVIGAAVSLLCIAAAFREYGKKDIF